MFSDGWLLLLDSALNERVKVGDGDACFQVFVELIYLSLSSFERIERIVDV